MADTVALTKSFGWTNEMYQQSDVQELARVLFEALEVSFKQKIDDDTPERILPLYRSKVQDYLKCMECGETKERTGPLFLSFQKCLLTKKKRPLS